ncbi:hypothetical protein AZE42_03932 [Rhizopogon vesiculosus]|uniref:Uncharacterized protein n=1 Tax=Rhizopogon vesiculosus TaxID=180088 RepID=A0A1J8PSM0_9AGAM|nr:hypothetical protein AZE42_03932 [Rhizopogon vesiculosus]
MSVSPPLPPLEFVRSECIHQQRDYVASKEDGRRPYALLFCLSWFQNKEKKPDPTPHIYHVDLMNAEQEDDPLDIPVPTRVRFVQQEDNALTAMTSQSQPEAGPSHLAET